jgi:hypothetical protein
VAWRAAVSPPPFIASPLPIGRFPTVGRWFRRMRTVVSPDADGGFAGCGRWFRRMRTVVSPDSRQASVNRIARPSFRRMRAE